MGRSGAESVSERRHVGDSRRIRKCTTSHHKSPSSFNGLDGRALWLRFTGLVTKGVQGKAGLLLLRAMVPHCLKPWHVTTQGFNHTRCHTISIWTPNGICYSPKQLLQRDVSVSGLWVRETQEELVRPSIPPSPPPDARVAHIPFG